MLVKLTAMDSTDSRFAHLNGPGTQDKEKRLVN